MIPEEGENTFGDEIPYPATEIQNPMTQSQTMVTQKPGMREFFANNATKPFVVMIAGSGIWLYCVFLGLFSTEMTVISSIFQTFGDTNIIATSVVLLTILILLELFIAQAQKNELAAVVFLILSADIGIITSFIMKALVPIFGIQPVWKLTFTLGVTNIMFQGSILLYQTLVFSYYEKIGAIWISIGGTFVADAILVYSYTAEPSMLITTVILFWILAGIFALSFSDSKYMYPENYWMHVVLNYYGFYLYLVLRMGDLILYIIVGLLQCMK